MSAAASSPALAPVARRRRASSRVGRVLSTLLLLVATMLLLAVLVLGANGIRIRVEQTGSMAPALRPGDLVLVQSVPVSTVRTGDVVGVRTATGQVIVHRVTRVDGAGGSLRVTTKGDANPTGETWTIPRSDAVALVRGRVPAAGAIVDAIKGPWAALAVLAAGMLLAASQLRRIWGRTA